MAGPAWLGDFPGAGALLLGGARYDMLPDLPSIPTTLADLALALEQRCGLSPESIRTEYPATPIEMGEAIATATEAASGLLLVYFAGHGLVSPSGALYLATERTDTRRFRLEHTALPYDTLRRYLLESAAQPVIIMLDCCFSGRALPTLADPEDEVANLAEIDGAFVLTAAGRNETAMAPPGERHTAFAAELLRLLDQGDPAGPAGLSLQQVYRHLNRTLPAAGFPRPRSRSSGTAGQLVLAPNRAYRSVPEPPVSVATPHTPPVPDACPYKGLAAFDAEDGAWFHGRDRVTTELVTHVAARYDDARPLFVTGASGSGKSSLLRAGLLPAIGRGALGLPGSEAWPRFLLTPTADPLGALAACLGTDPAPDLLTAALHALSAERAVIVVDQFEEVFTDCQDEKARQAFIGVLHQAATSTDALVVIGLSADMYGRCTAYPELARAMQERQIVVGPMTGAELRAAINRPATAAGLTLEPGLEDVILTDLGVHEADGYEAGRLPLLSHALLATWRRRRGRTLTLAGYRETGGIRGALAATADAALAILDGPGRATARVLLRRLVHLGEGGEDTRRRVDHHRLLAELPDPRQGERVLRSFAADRLITVDDGTVQITHEALLRGWPTLRGWLAEDRTGLLVEQHLLEAAQAWDREARDPAALYRGSRLTLAEEWAADRVPGVLAGAFLDASVRREQAEKALTRRRGRVLRGFAFSVSVLLVAALAAGRVAIQQTEVASGQRDIAVARETAARADGLRTSDPVAAMKLSVAAWRIAPVKEAKAALYSSLARPERDISTVPQVTTRARFDLRQDGSALAIVDQERAILWDVAAHREIGRAEGVDGSVQAVALSPDGWTLAVGGDRSLRRWDLRTGTPVGGEISTRALRIDFSRSGESMAVATRDDRWEVWRTSDATLRIQRYASRVEQVIMSPDDRLAVPTFTGGRYELWDLGTRRRLAAPGGDRAESLAFSPDARTLAIGRRSGVEFWPLRGKAASAVLTEVRAEWLGYSQDGRFIATLDGGMLQLWTLGGQGLLSYELTITPGVPDPRFGPGSRTISYYLADGAVVVLDLAPYIEPALVPAPVSASVFSADGTALAVQARDGVEIWNVMSRRRGAVVPVREPTALALSADGRMLAEIHAQGEVLDQRTEGDQLIVRARLPEKLRGRLEQAGAKITSAV